MPVAGSHPQVVLHSFAGHRSLRVVPLERQRIVTFGTDIVNRTATHKEFVDVSHDVPARWLHTVASSRRTWVGATDASWNAPGALRTSVKGRTVPALSDAPSQETITTGSHRVPLPTSLAEAIGQEYRRISRPPFEALLTVALNAAMMTSAWFFLPPDLVDKVFELHGSLAFAFVLSSWMYSDVPATIVLAIDAPHILTAIDQPKTLRRILAARRFVLWSVVAPVCLLISFIIGFGMADPVVAIYSVVVIGVIRYGVLAVSGWLGIAFPYHPVPIRFRWMHRRQRWPMLGRWATLVLLPYVLVPGLSFAFMAPRVLIWGFTSKTGLTKTLPDNDVGLGFVLACAIAIGTAYIGQRVSLRLIVCHRARLVTYLSDPRLG